MLSTFLLRSGRDQMAPAVVREMAIMYYQVEPEFRCMHREEWTPFNKHHDRRVEEANRSQKAAIPEGIITHRKVTNSVLTIDLMKSQEHVTKKSLDMCVILSNLDMPVKRKKGPEGK